MPKETCPFHAFIETPRSDPAAVLPRGKSVRPTCTINDGLCRPGKQGNCPEIAKWLPIFNDPFSPENMHISREFLNGGAEKVLEYIESNPDDIPPDILNRLGSAFMLAQLAITEYYNSDLTNAPEYLRRFSVTGELPHKTSNSYELLLYETQE